MRRLLTAVVGCAGVIVFFVPASAENWPQFRGPNRDGISRETGLLRKWPDGGPNVLWKVDACQGFAGPAIFNGRVYLNDYDEKTAEWLVRCLSLADGKELWRFREPKKIRPNHAITRTVPAVDGKYVFSLDPKCVYHCLAAETGKELWRKDLPKDYGTVIPNWYNGQCPLIEPDRVLIAMGGSSLLAAFDKATGKPVWETPNPDKLSYSHSSLMPAEIGGVKQYIYCTIKGLVGIAAADGKLLWSFPWKFHVAVAPSPLPIGDGRVFMTSLYDADSVMIRVKRDGERLAAEKLFSLSPAEWNSEVQTPILHKDRMFGVGKKERGLFPCLNFDGKIVWTSQDKASFGLGSYILADGMFLVLDGDTGMLRLIEADTTAYKELDKAQVLSGKEVWAPMALSDGKVVLRDMTKMVCIDVRGPK
jgi:outer membrane protein assembly factor BamB